MNSKKRKDITLEYVSKLKNAFSDTNNREPGNYRLMQQIGLIETMKLDDLEFERLSYAIVMDTLRLSTTCVIRESIYFIEVLTMLI